MNLALLPIFLAVGAFVGQCPARQDRSAFTCVRFAAYLYSAWAGEWIDQHTAGPSSPCVTGPKQVVAQKSVFLFRDPASHALVVRTAFNDQIGARIRSYGEVWSLVRRLLQGSGGELIPGSSVQHSTGHGLPDTVESGPCVLGGSQFETLSW